MPPDYPSSDQLTAITEASPREALQLLGSFWITHYGSMRTTLTNLEAGLLGSEDGPSEPPRYVRLATGGWSGNEELLSAFRSNIHYAWALTWRLSASGGLHIFRMPPEEQTALLGPIETLEARLRAVAKTGLKFGPLLEEAATALKDSRRIALMLDTTSHLHVRHLETTTVLGRPLQVGRWYHIPEDPS